MIPITTLRKNLQAVKGRIAAAASRAGRSADAVSLVAVTKTVGVDEVSALYDIGVREFGESRMQVALAKMADLAELKIRWHMIGRLQTNKANKVPGKFHLLHSLDSLRLAAFLDRAAKNEGAVIDALIEVNVSGEDSKTGLSPKDLPETVETIQKLHSNLRVTGLMTMAPESDDPENARPFFRHLRELRDSLSPAHAALQHLSMGMTQDFEVAIEEGADIIRVGTALFVP